MEPFRIKGSRHLVGNKSLRIETQLRAARARQVCAQACREAANRSGGEIKIAVMRLVRVRGQLLSQPGPIRTGLNSLVSVGVMRGKVWSALAISASKLTRRLSTGRAHTPTTAAFS